MLWDSLIVVVWNSFYDLAEITCIIKTACVSRLVIVSNTENDARQCLFVKGGVCTTR